jgi:hypothetical protein
MFTHDGYRMSQSSGSDRSQTHIFTSFPDSAIDLDDDLPLENPTNADQLFIDKPTDNDQCSHSLPITNQDITHEQYHQPWHIEYYQSYFQIDTQQIIERLRDSFVPRMDKSHFNSSIRQNPDLYGPIWISITFILTLTICGNLMLYFYTPNDDFQFDFSKMTLSATVSKQLEETSSSCCY